MNQQQPYETRLIGSPQATLEDAMFSAAGGKSAVRGDILHRYEVVQVCGKIDGNEIGTWQVVLKPRFVAKP